MKQQNRWGQFLHLFVLFELAVAAPLLDVFSKNAEFFVARQSRPIEIYLFVFLLCFLVPAVIAFLQSVVGYFNHTAQQILHGILLLLFLSALISIGLKDVRFLPDISKPLLAVTTAIAVLIGYFRTPIARVFFTFLCPALLVVPTLFFVNPSIRKLTLPAEVNAFSGAIASKTPVVLVIFDELPVASLMNLDMMVDSVAYPNFAQLASESVWFRNATTVSDSTTYAVPAIVTGSYPTKGRLPILAEYPRSLFTLLEDSYEMRVFESMTSLYRAPASGKNISGKLWSNILSMFADASAVYFVLVAPPNLTRDAPEVTQAWGNFWTTHAATWKRPHSGREGRAEKFALFINSIRETPKPALYFAHVMLPHFPWEYLPSGKRYDQPLKWMKITDAEDGIEHYRRHLLQLRFVDKLLGNLIDRMKTAGIYDRALLIITSDHGASFSPGSLRYVNKKNYYDIMPIPLFVKLPFSRKGMIDDRNAETIDILPTIAEGLGVALPWKVDGHSLLSSSPARPAKTMLKQLGIRDEHRFRVEPDIVAKYKTVQWKFTLFTSDPILGRSTTEARR